MNYAEDALLFAAAGEELVAMLARPEVPGDCAVLIVVGGPQYRVGSHRQFLLLARQLAEAGYPVLRFDCRGMGDSSGEARTFDAQSADIGAAIDALQRACPAVKRIVLWGLCDAASAALLYVEASGDARLAGLVLLNPWVRSEASLAQTQLKHYYGQRLLERAFWRKLLSGKMRVFGALGDFLQSARRARGGDAGGAFQERMAAGLRKFPGAVLLILSGQDYTAKEFIDHAAADAAWTGLLARDTVHRVDLGQADHTFSTRVQRALVEAETLAFLRRLTPP